jgi:hypothetical protein
MLTLNILSTKFDALVMEQVEVVNIAKRKVKSSPEKWKQPWPKIEEDRRLSTREPYEDGEYACPQQHHSKHEDQDKRLSRDRATIPCSARNRHNE